MKILITGANGLLGQKLVRLLIDKKETELIATSRGASRLPMQQGYVYESMDVTDAKEVSGQVAKHKPDAIIHTAAMTNVDECHTQRDLAWEMNVKSVQNIVDAAAENNAFLLHLSTDFIFDGKNGPYDEEAKPKPVNYYGETKLEAEKIITKSNIDWAIARTVLVYGIAHDMSRSNIILWVKNSLEEGKTLQIVDDQWRTPTLAEDLAQGCYLIAKNRAKGIFNISGKDFLTPYEMAIKTADYFNLDKKLINKTDSSNFSQPALRPPRTGFDISKAKNLLNYQPHSFDEGIAVINEQLATKN